MLSTSMPVTVKGYSNSTQHDTTTVFFLRRDYFHNKLNRVKGKIVKYL